MINYYSPAFLVCTIFGIGKIIPKAPGTIGSIIAIPFAIFLFAKSHTIYEWIFSDGSTPINAFFISLLLLIVFFVASCFLCHKYIQLDKNKDPKEVIIDEVIGQSLVIICTLPFTSYLIFGTENLSIQPNINEVFVTSCTAALALFRFFDIMKPWPIKNIEKRFTNGFGIMIDDIVAAILAILFYYFFLIFVVIDRVLT